MGGRKKTRKLKSPGLAPGTLVYTGEPRHESVPIRVFRYNEATVTERVLDHPDAVWAGESPDTITWIDCEGVHDVALVRALGDRFGWNPLVLEDILNPAQRPKVDYYDSYLYIVVRMFYEDRETRKITSEQVSLLLGPCYIVSFQEKPGDVWEPVRESLRKNAAPLRKGGPDFLVYALLDAIVDHYFVLLERFGEATEGLEEEIFKDPRPRNLETLHEMRRDLMLLRRSIWPLRDAVTLLWKFDSPLVAASTRTYLSDLYDHTIRAVETLETYHELLTGLADLYLSTISFRTNEIMKVLTIIATIFIPLTFVVGVYGMNFEYFPELKWRWGYFAVWGAMVALAIGMLHMFRRKRWL
jgi:magnesium transporter